MEKVSDADILAVMRTAKNPGGAARQLGIARSSLVNRLRRMEKRDGQPVASDSKEQFEQKWERDKGYVHSVSPSVKTVEDAIAKANIDLDIWEVERQLINSWEMVAKLRQADGTDKCVTTPLWQVKVWLRRKVAKVAEDALQLLIDRSLKDKPRKHPKPKHTRKSDPCLLEVSLFDHHFGAHAWGKETGQPYDLKIAEALYLNAVEDLLHRSPQDRVERILFPVGSDFFHINDVRNATPKNQNPLDVDNRLPKVFSVGAYAVQQAIGRCLEVAPVDVLWIPGNHDQETSWFLAFWLKAWYRNSKHVEIDCSPTWRKYRQYGRALLGFTHGDEEPHRDLPAIMAAEVPELWAQSDVREWHVGHLHKKKQTHFSAADTWGGVVVRTLPSLCGTDAWHYRKGYINKQRAAEAYLWGKRDGYVGHLSVNARDD